MSDTRPIYRIPAREVVPGMILCCREFCWPVTAVGHGWLEVLNEDPRRFVIRKAGVATVQLPGPSPRELACTCCVIHLAAALDARGRPADAGPEDAIRLMAVADHQSDCPVAPVPGKHGGLRLWPAPWRGQSWQWTEYGGWVALDERRTAGIFPVYTEDLMADPSAPGAGDVILQCFYLPPEPQPERREPTPWAPHAGYEDLAVKYG